MSEQQPTEPRHGEPEGGAGAETEGVAPGHGPDEAHSDEAVQGGQRPADPEPSTREEQLKEDAEEFGEEGLPQITLDPPD